jgi:nucleotide-binding universal stress UspA family protein
VVARFKTVLVATDFSELGNAAIPLAYGAANPGATIHLVHVIPAERPRIDPHDIFHPLANETTIEAMKAAETKLPALVPVDASARSVGTRVHAVESADPGEAICQMAERLSADLICLGTHGRSGLAKAALGSVAARVSAHSRRPLLLARGQSV